MSKKAPRFKLVATARTSSGCHEQFTTADFRADAVPPGTELYIRLAPDAAADIDRFMSGTNAQRDAILRAERRSKSA